MIEFLSIHYLWIKALHVMSVIAWMAGLFYLPRLFVYHAESAAVGSDLSETLKVMERRLLRAIMNPAMIAAWTFGGLLVLIPGIADWSTFNWVYVKAAMVLVMTWFHHWLANRRKEFAVDSNVRSGRTYRLMNELPTVLMIVIVAMVIVKPF
ncbi:MAG: protoporphyrinogen oxidase HemJ [Paracoccaceae bacterium]